MTLTLGRVVPAELDEVIAALASWQRGVSVQVHPGDLGWHRRHGDDVLARCLRVWLGPDGVEAVAYVDDGVARLGVSPLLDSDAEAARGLVDDLTDPGRGVLIGPNATVEVREGAALRAEFARRGWADDEPWTPLSRDLGHPVEGVDLRVRVVDAADDAAVADRVAVQRAAFSNSTLTPSAWQAMASAEPYRDARCLVGYADGAPVAAITVWSAGPGRPGLVEPMGVHREHRSRGFGRAITVAGAAALRELGASHALVATASANVGGVRTYVAAGFTPGPAVRDVRRPG